jgi:hypothetical protein
VRAQPVPDALQVTLTVRIQPTASTVSRSASTTRSSPLLSVRAFLHINTRCSSPADLSLPPTDEKGLPLIIVTPSSPTHEREFFLAWVPPPPPAPSAIRRFFSRGGGVQLPPSPTTARAEKEKSGVTLRWRTVLLLALLFTALVAHVLTRGLAARRPRLFVHPVAVAAAPAAGVETAPHGLGKMLGIEWLFAEEEVEERDFVVEALGRR